MHILNICKAYSFTEWVTNEALLITRLLVNTMAATEILIIVFFEL